VLPSAAHLFLLSEETSKKKNNKIIIGVILISIIITLALIVVSPIIIEMIFPKFVEGIQSLQIMIISFIPLTIADILNAKLQAKDSLLIGYSAIVRIGSLMALIAVLGSLYDLIGLSIAVLISSALYSVSLYIIYNKSKN